MRHGDAVGEAVGKGEGWALRGRCGEGEALGGGGGGGRLHSAEACGVALPSSSLKRSSSMLSACVHGAAAAATSLAAAPASRSHA